MALSVLAVSDEDISKRLRQPQARLIECRGNTLLPGFIDAHCHLWSTATRSICIDLSPRERVFSIDDIKSKIKNISKTVKPGAWIRAMGYNEYNLSEKRHPKRWDLDQAAPNVH